MNKILITERQLEILTNIVLNEQEMSSEVTSHPLYKSFVKKLSDYSKKIWTNTNRSYTKKGLTLDDEERIALLNQFQELLNRGKKYKNAKQKYKKLKTINIKGKNMKLETLPTVEEDMDVNSCPTLQFDIAAIGDSNYEPFKDNSYELGDGLKDDIQVLVDDIKGLQSDYEGKLQVKVLNFDVKTSASRIRNGGKYNGKSFLKLSKDRTTNVVNTITKALQNIGVEVPQPTVNFKGKNGDGSSGPHPRDPYKMVKDEGDTQTVDNNQDRTAYGAPLNTDADYDKFKYCIVTLVISGKVEGDEDEGKVEADTELKQVTQEWGLRLAMKRRRKIKLPNWRISFKKRYKNPRRRKITSKMLTKCPKW